jgi:hypothetical protein
MKWRLTIFFEEPEEIVSSGVAGDYRREGPQRRSDPGTQSSGAEAYSTRQIRAHLGGSEF